MLKYVVVKESGNDLAVVDICSSIKEAEDLAAGELKLLKGDELENSVIAIREIAEDVLDGMSDFSIIKDQKLVKELKK